MNLERWRWPKLIAYLTGTWGQAEHGVITAPTGRGKTVLIEEVTKLRDSTIFFGTKKDDPEYDRMLRGEWERIRRYPPRRWQKKVLFWPERGATIRETKQIQKERFRPALDHLFMHGRWSVVFDELHWMAHDLGLYEEIASMHHQGRSSRLTFIDGFQRPAWVPRIVYSSASHLFAWGTNDPNDIRQLASFGGVPAKELTPLLKDLDKYEFLYFDVRNPKFPVIRSQVER